MTLEETLKKLNKGKAEQDQVKKVSEIDTLNLDFSSSFLQPSFSQAFSSQQVFLFL